MEELFAFLAENRNEVNSENFEHINVYVQASEAIQWFRSGTGICIKLTGEMLEKAKEMPVNVQYMYEGREITRVD